MWNHPTVYCYLLQGKKGKKKENSSINVQTLPCLFVIFTLFFFLKRITTTNTTNARHVNKASSSSILKKEWLFCMLQSNCWNGFGGFKYNCRHLGYWHVCLVGRSQCETTVMLSTADSETAEGSAFHQWCLTHAFLGVGCSQAKYMVRKVSWWTWTALAKAWWSRPLLWPDVWLPSALKEKKKLQNCTFFQQGDKRLQTKRF